MKGYGVILLIFALALLAPRESSGSRAYDASIGWKSRPLLRDSVPTLASGSHHARSIKDREAPGRRSTQIRVGIGVALLATGIFLISR